MTEPSPVREQLIEQFREWSMGCFYQDEMRAEYIRLIDGIEEAYGHLEGHWEAYDVHEARKVLERLREGRHERD